MANGMEMIVNALLKASGFTIEDLKREASTGIAKLEAFTRAQLDATAALERIEAAIERIESRLNGSPALPDPSEYPREAFGRVRYENRIGPSE